MTTTLDSDRKTPSRRKATIYDLARVVGASPATVSMVLNGKWRANRISPVTAERILAAAREADYSVNRSARGLRLAQSGLAGMIIPQYQNRFFGEMAEVFEAEARQRGLCPIVVSTQRDASTETEVVETLLAHQVESIFLAGAVNPTPLNEAIRRAGVRCVNVDLPGPGAPSVVTDNRGGAEMLAERLLRQRRPTGHTAADRFFFLGGRGEDHATRERVAGFEAAITAAGLEPSDGVTRICGYDPDQTARAIAEIYSELGRLPAALFVNSITAFEGVVRYFKSLPSDSFDDVAIGCFDWNPFAQLLPFPVVMVAQDVERMIAEAFRLSEDQTRNLNGEILVSVPPRLIEAEPPITAPV